MATLGEVAAEVYRRLIAVGLEPVEARCESELILQHTTGLKTAQQFARADHQLAVEIYGRIDEIVSEREKRVPLQYLLGESWFMGLRFLVTPAVLIPRADTETLVEVALKLLKDVPQPRILDVGTGSGIIAVSICKFRSDARALALDISDSALAVARQNAHLHHVAHQLEFVHGDFNSFETQPQSKRPFHGIVSNPPYVPRKLASELQPEVAVFEPEQAVFGLDEDGLGFYRVLSEKAERCLIEGGFVAVEVGQGQAQPVKKIFAERGWANLGTYQDLNKIERVVSANRPDLIIGPHAGLEN